MNMWDSVKGDVYSVLTGVVWSGAVIYYRLAGLQLEAVPLKFFQNSVTALLFFVAAWVVDGTMALHLSLEHWLLLALSAFFGIALADTMYIASIRRVGAGAQAILDCLYAPTVVVFAFFAFGERLTTNEMVGASLILAAIFVATYGSGFKGETPRDTFVGVTLGLLAQVAMALTVVVIRDLLRTESVFAVLAYRYAIGNLFLLGPGLVWPQLKIWTGFTTISSWRNSLAGAVLGPFLATLFWFLGFKYTSAGRAAIYNQLSSIFILLLAAYFLREHLTRVRVIAIAMALVGGYFVSS